MRATLHAAFADDINLVTDGITNLRQLVERRTSAIQLSSTMVRNHYPRASNIDRFFRVLHAHNAL